MANLFSILRLVAQETFGAERLQRRPEPAPVMAALESVLSFHEQGSETGALLPIYHFNALAMSRLIPQGGRILDLGSGSGRYLAYLACFRPDIDIIGVDLSAPMVEMGNRMLKLAGLRDRVELRAGDMTDFRALPLHRVDLISSVFSLHHLPNVTDLDKCLEQIRAARQQHGSSVWIFDHARPHHPSTATMFPEIFTSNASLAFREDSKNSLIASFSFAELCDRLDNGGMGEFHHALSKLIRLYQVHWISGQALAEAPDCTALEVAGDLPSRARRELQGLMQIFRSVPLVKRKHI